MERYDFGVLIGRFQPFHLGHLDLVKYAYSKCKQVIILVGSSNTARSCRNPFSYPERHAFIKNSIKELGSNYLGGQESPAIFPLKDFFYNENKWVKEVQKIVGYETSQKKNPSICLFGHNKEDTYYLNSFPQWHYEEFPENIMHQRISATKVRQSLAAFGAEGVKGVVCPTVYQMLQNYEKSDHYIDFTAELEFVESYKSMWKNTPYPVTFVTVDAVVVCSGHVLCVRRKGMPGIGLYALPGGFLSQDFTVLDGAIRELKEETRIKIPQYDLKRYVQKEKVFDYPTRSARGRTITHAFYIQLPDGDLPLVKGSDDAEKAIWIPLSELEKLDTEFFEDHLHIIDYFIS